MNLNVYHTKFRVLDPELGRWWQIDPLTDKSNNISAYAFVMNNPLRYTDASGLDTLDAVVIVGKATNAVRSVYQDFSSWFSGSNVGYNGSGWGHGPRRYLANKIGLGNSASNLFELGLHSQLQSGQVNLTGGLPEGVKEDPDMINFQNNIIKALKADPRFKNVAFVVKGGGKVIQFGPPRWTGPNEDWGALNRNNPITHLATWKVGADKMTWATRHATIDYSATVKSDGTIVLSFNLSDTLDLSGQNNRSDAYSNISNVTGLLYHDLTGGNSALKINASWEVTTK
jgi:hypothetical protein